jgi:3-oxoacid CoA-transferase A subunit
MLFWSRILNKIYDSPHEAVKDIYDGATVMIGGWASSGVPTQLILALRNQGAKDLTIVANSPDTGRFIDNNILVKNHQVKRFICTITFPGTQAVLAEAAGELEIELVPQGTLAERIRAAGCGLGGFFTPTGVGTLVAEGKETRIIDGKEYLFELPLKADFALIKAYKADEFGNLTYRGAMRNFNAIMATAADITVAQVEEVVKPGVLDQDSIVTPQIFVDRVIKTLKSE